MVLRFYIVFLLLILESVYCDKEDLRDFFYTVKLVVNSKQGIFETLSGVISDSKIESEIKSLKIFSLKDKSVGSMDALKERIDSDVATINKNLHVDGFYDSEVNYSISADSNSEAHILIKVDLKNKFKLKINIKFLDQDETFNENYSNSLRSKFGQKRASMQEIHDVIEGTLQLLRSRGFYNPTAVKKRVFIDYEKKEALLNLEIITGQCVNFGKVHISSFPGIDPEFIANRLSWSEGELFNGEKIDKSIEKLRDTQIFSSISITPEVEKITDSEIPILIEVEEDKKHAIDFSLMYTGIRNMNFEKRSQANKGLKSIVTRISWSRFNAFGSGERLTVNAEGTPMKTGTRRVDYGFEVNLMQPDVFARDADMKYRIGRRQELTNVFFKKSDKLQVQYDYPISEFLYASLGTVWEKNYIDSEDVFFANGRLKRRYENVAVPIALNCNQTDNSLNPCSGYFVVSEFAISKLFRMQESNLKTYKISYSYYYPFEETKENILAFYAAKRGIICKNIDDVPLDKRIYAGGLGSIRGYANQMATEMIRGVDTMMGGKSALELSCEYRRKINRDWGMTTFVEGAKVYGNKSRYFEIEKKRWFFSIGVGARYYTSIGPIRLDFAFPLRRRKCVDSKMQFIMSLGQAF